MTAGTRAERDSGGAVARLADRAGRLWRRRYALRPQALGAIEPMAPPVFIVGCGHSGTTLLLAILDRHPSLHAIPYESNLITRPAGEVDWFVTRFNRAARRAGKTAWVEKTPSQVRHIGRLLERFPDARIVVMIRDGRDVACSIEARSGDFEAGARRWEDDNAAAHPWSGHRSVWYLKYEDLIEDQETVLLELCGFLGLGFEPALLDHESGDFTFLGRFQDHRKFAQALRRDTAAPATPAGDGHRRYRSWQASQPVFDGRGRWRLDMTADQKAIFKEIAGARLVQYGYEADGDW